MAHLEVPTNILVISEIDDSEHSIHITIKEAFSMFGRVEEMKLLGDKCVIVYRHVHSAISAKTELKHLPISFAGSVAEITNRFEKLEVPPFPRNMLLSPPPSPPENWRQPPEDINRIPFLDLDADVFEGSTQVLLQSVLLPKITVDDCE